MAQFFINRPIFAWVIAIIIMLGGALSIVTLPLEQYPDIAPPRVTIGSQYTGASAETVENSVTQIIEQQLKGIDNMLYMSSTSDASGRSRTTLTFAPGTNIDVAQVQVQNKLQAATNRLPDAVKSRGVFVNKGGQDFLVTYSFFSKDPSMSAVDIGDFLTSSLVDVIGRIDGVGDVTVFGTNYAMRIWMDPAKMEKYALMPSDLVNALNAQNAQVSAGQLGALPAVSDQQLNATITARTKLKTVEQFERIVLKSALDGSVVTIKDVARVELGAENLTVKAKLNGMPGAGMGIVLADGANAMQVADAIAAKLAELKPYFPNQIDYFVSSDSTPFVRASIKEVVSALGEAMILVVIVMFVFLQNFRATLIPAIAVPVVLLGTFGVLSLAGYSINTLTMFAMVLAIGLLVDDAIVVVENVERVMAEEGLSPKEATRKAMGQITGALIGVALVLSAVFVPVAFSGGSVGAIYRQFSLTIVSAMVLSVLVALILTPALCATILKPIPQGHHEEKQGFFGWFNRTFNQSRDKYHVGVHHVIKRSGRWLIIYLVVIVAVGLLFVRLPKSFLPDEDQGLMFVIVQTPSGSTQETTAKTLANISDYLLNDEKEIVESAFTVNGFSFAGRGQNSGLVFVRLKDYAQRQHANQKVQALIGRMFGRYAGYKDALVIPFNPPSIPELGTAAGFDFELTDNAGLGHDALMAARNQLLMMAAKDPTLQGVRPNGLNDTPQYKVDIDREKAAALGVTPAAIDQTFSIAWASKYVNNFLDIDGRIKKVYVQADAPFRMKPDDLNIWYVRNGTGGMVPFGAFATGHWTYGSPKLERYNGISAMEIQGQAAAGKSTGQAMAAMESLAKKLPDGIGYSWTGLSFQEIQSGSQAPILYAISILVVFLCLAALYESWSIPFSVIMVVPLGVIGALLAATMRGLENDVYFQVGLLTTVGLSAKNAILIVEFARELQQSEKMGPIEAALEAARLRLRPILMTSLAFILGVLPLAISNGAGSASQHAIGTGVIGGMITATFLAIFMIPMFFVKVRSIFSGEKEDVDEALRLAQDHLHQAEQRDHGDDEKKGQ